MTIAVVLDSEVVHTGTNFDAIHTIAEAPDAAIASSLGENEGVTACATPELISLQAPKRGIDGRGLNTSEGFVVFAGSYALTATRHRLEKPVPEHDKGLWIPT